MPSTLYALTLYQPWAWAIAEGFKKIENRRWKPPLEVLRGNSYIAIHAGATIDEDGLGFLEFERGLTLPETYVQRAIVAIAKLDGVVTESSDPYFFGPYGWVLKDVVKLAEPLPARGFQKLWRPTPDMQVILRERYARAIAS